MVKSMEKEINPEKHSMTPLMVFAAKGEKEYVADLIASGVDINSQDSRGGTALMYAVMNGHIDIVKLLLDAGADTGIRTKTGATADSFSYHSHSDEIAKLLATSRHVPKKSVVGLSGTRLFITAIVGMFVGYTAIKLLVVYLGGKIGMKIIGVVFLGGLALMIIRRLMSKNSEDGTAFKLMLVVSLLMAIVMIGANISGF